LKILVVGEAPGEEEDKQNTQLIGPAGQRLRKELKKFGADLDRDCWKTNAVVCCPHGNPTNRQIESCRPNLLKTIQVLKPRTIILLGLSAVRSVIGWLWKSDLGSMERWAGWQIPCQRWNCWICPTYHSSYVRRVELGEKGGFGEKKLVSGEVLGILFGEHLQLAFKLTERPWKERPRFDQVEKIVDTNEAAKRIECLIRAKPGVPIAFDYETDRLKPDSDGAEIRCCAMSNGEETIAYPIHGSTYEATRRFLRCPVPKIAANTKFEERWSRAVFKTSVRNWSWCTMLGAHVLDNRRGITGLKFQAFVRLGQETYNDVVASYLKESNSNKPNRIRQADWRDLLQYNGMDASLTWHVAKRQQKEMDESSCSLGK